MFEEAAASAFGVRAALATGSGRGALELLLAALELPTGGEVILPALTFHAVPTSIERCGFQPRFVDVDEASIQMSPDAVAAAIGPQTVAILGTHLAGFPCDVDRLGSLAEDAGVPLLEDLAQAGGGTRRGRWLGSFGRAGFTSLETVKTLPAFGGGLLLTDDVDLARRLRPAVDALPAPASWKLAKKVAMGHVEAALADPRGFSVAWPLLGGDVDGWIARYKGSKQSAGNHGAALHPAQASMATLALANLPSHIAERRRCAEQLRAELGGTWTPHQVIGDTPAWYQYLARSEDPDRLRVAAADEGVDVGLGVLTDLSGGTCPVAAELARTVVQLPAHPALTDDDRRRVARVVRPHLI